MNIFIMVIVFLFMAGWYFLDAPSQKIRGTDIETALADSGLRSLAECFAQSHAAILSERESNLDCAETYQIQTMQVCVDQNDRVVKCAEDRIGKFPASFVITKSPPIAQEDTHAMMRVLGSMYPNVGNFGVLMYSEQSNYLMAANGAKREIPTQIAKDANLENLQLLYVTKIPVQVPMNAVAAEGVDVIDCPPNQVRVIRGGQWQCVSANLAAVCTGDTIWDSVQEACVIDPKRRPLCAENQTAVQVDDYWECMDPLMDKECPGGTVPRLDYSTMEWECVINPETARAITKCELARIGTAGSTIGTTVRVPLTSCTDCEEMITDPETCEVRCTPSAEKLSNRACYNGSCSGVHRAFYFGFPYDAHYMADVAKSIPQLSDVQIPFDAAHSQNRKFNCLDCGTRYIDSRNSMVPYVAVCD